MKEKPIFSKELLLNGVAIIGVFLIFVLILSISYVPNRLTSVDKELGVQRKATLQELNAEQSKLLNNYGWVNQPEGIVRIPVRQAMEMVVQEYQGNSARGLDS